MKKVTLLFLPFLIAAAAMAQNESLIRNIQKVKSAPVSKEYQPKELHSSSKVSHVKSGTRGTVYYGTEIGDSYYDLQSNGPSPTNIVQYDDGSIAVVYIHNDDTASLSATRGAGYAYYNASTQLWNREENPSNGIFDTRVGWPVIGNSSSNEFVIAHGSSPTQMVSVNRANKGSGLWSGSTTYFNDEYLWPKMAVVGDTIHLLGSCNGCPNGPVGGMNNMMWYSRSTDGGLTFDIMMQALPGCDTTNFPAVPFSNGPNSSLADDYNIDAVGNTVAVVAGGGSYSMHAWKSTDGGSNWTFIPIADREEVDTSNGQGYVVFDSVAMTTNTRIFHPGDDPNVVIDNNGQVHVFAGAIEQSWDGTLTWSGRAASSGIMYWNESMAGSRPISIADMLMDIDCDGSLDYALADDQTGGYGIDNGASRGVTAAVDANNNIFLVTSSIIEGTIDLFRLLDPATADSVYIRDLMMLYSTDGGLTWSYPINVASQLAGYVDNFDTLDLYKGTRFGEDVFPTMIKHVGSDNTLHMYYQTDESVGSASASTGLQNSAEGGPGVTVNNQVYFGVDINTVLATTGFNTDSCELNYQSGVGLSQIESLRSLKAFPNPARDLVTINVDLKFEQAVSIEITDLMGRTVERQVMEQTQSGVNQFDFSISKLNSGIYIYKVSVGDRIYSEKFVKE